MFSHWPRIAAGAGVLLLLLAAAAAAGILMLLMAAPPAAATEQTPIAGEQVSHPLFFPVGGTATTGARTHYWASRADGVHHAQDILAPEMTPLHAAAPGTVQ